MEAPSKGGRNRTWAQFKKYFLHLKGRTERMQLPPKGRSSPKNTRQKGRIVQIKEPGRAREVRRVSVALRDGASPKRKGGEKSNCGLSSE